MEESDQEIQNDIESQIKEDKAEKKQFIHEEIYVRKQHVPSKKPIKINTSRSRGQLKLLKMLCKKNNWLEVFKQGHILWSGLAIPQEQIDLATQIKINRIPAMPHLCHKRTMGFILNKFRQYWPEEFWFYPKTFLIPQDSQTLQKQIAKGGMFIAKPSTGCQGDGIVLIKKSSEIPKIGSTEWIVQPYIDKPLLLQNKKFDFRLYVLIASVDPYICFLNQQGLVRFCTQDYQEPNKQNFKNPYIHLTNYSLNKNSPKYQNGDSQFSRGSKRCLRVVWEDLIKNGFDVAGLKQKIISLCQKFLTGFYPFLKYYYHATFPKKKGKCFHVLGIDILVDKDGNPWLLQANNNPSFNIQHQAPIPGSNDIKKQVSPVDEYVKSIVVQDSIFLVNRKLDKLKEMEIGQNYYSYKKILDKESEQVKGMNIIQSMLKIFHSQCSIRSKWILTSTQFTKLSQLTGMTSQKITKNDYHLIFIKIMRNKQNPNQMQFEDFIQAIEYIIKQVVGYTKQNKLSVMQQHINFLVSQLPA